jgi:hypothetical protein
MKANFATDLKRGKDAEKEFLKKFPQLTELDGFKGDFITPSGLVVETKADFYSPLKWPNVIIERYSSKDKDGGPFQSKGHGASIYAYWFIRHDLLFLYPVDLLCIEVNRIVKEHNIKLENKENINHTTRFYRIPRVLLEHIQLKEEVLL